MKTILISTDFSTTATHAAAYGYNLAKQIKASVILCNAVIVPAEIPQSGMVVWPMDEYDILMEDSEKELKKLSEHLESSDIEGEFKPPINIINDTGILTVIISGIVTNNKADMIVMGTHAGGGPSQFLLGDHSRSMIDAAIGPLLLVPPVAHFKPVKKIAFATDLLHPDEDLKAIYKLIPLARQLNAEVLLAHVSNEKQQSAEFQQWLEQLLVDLSNKANYPNIFYRLIENTKPEDGLDWLTLHGQVDMLAMLHRPHSFFNDLLKGSHTKRIAEHINIPLLVFPHNSI